MTLTNYQLNRHNANQANIELTTQLADNKLPTLALIQEPYLHKGKIQYPQGCTKFEHHKNPRSTIYINKTLNFSLLPSLTNQYASTIAGNINGQWSSLAFIYTTNNLQRLTGWTK